MIESRTTLKSLELHGFKTFASKINFRFSDGITAVVGPNGSGKSNLADAVRWILGEQRTTMLRARKSEDLIFNGTERRARMGMAQGFITLDNSSGVLPIDFSEVVIGRRIYRSGESEYLINGSRARLRDIQELLAHASVGTTTYTVIGQGLVDAALAQRVEERRQLFEDAAGLGAYQGKRDEALRRLEQTEEHLTRVRDILIELEPRLKRLKRQAERAAEHQELTETLLDLLRQLYGYRWGQASEALTQGRSAVAVGRNELQAAALEVTGVEQRLERLRGRQTELRDLLAEQRRERGRLRAEAEQLRRERAVAAERERGFERQQEALRQEIAALESEQATLQVQLATLLDEGEQLQRTRRDALARLESSKQALAGAEAVREGIRRALAEARRALGKITARQGELAQQQTALADRQKGLVREQQTHEQALTELAERLVRREAELALLEEEIATIQQQRGDALSERQRLLAARQQAVAAQRDAQAKLHEVQRRLTEVTTRRELLARLRQEGAGYEGGVRTLLASRQRFGTSVLGPVAEQLRVPEALATAISAALASELQAVVLRDGADPVRAWLHEAERGRVTLLPHPALRGPERLPLPEQGGVLGRGADLVQADDPALLEHLLGGWLVLERWEDGAALHESGWNLVTLDGQVRRQDGAIIAGRGKGSGNTLLAQSREWAELPARLAAVEGEQAAANEALFEATDALEEVEAQLSRLERTLLEVERQAQKAEAAFAREQRDAEKLQQEQSWRRGLLAKLQQEREETQARAATLGSELGLLGEERAQAEARIAEVEQQLEAAHPGTLREAVERARTEVAVTDEQLGSWRRGRQLVEESLARLAQRQTSKAQQMAQLDAEAGTLGARLEAITAEAERAEAALAQSAERTRPLEQEQARNEEGLAELETLHLALRKRRQQQEDQLHTAQLTLQSAEERLNHLHEQIETDLGMVEVEEGEGVVHQSLLPLEELVTSLPRVVVLPDGLENDVRRLRRRIGYLGVVNPDAPAEFAEMEERFTFLTEQGDDLSRASRDLREIVAELDEIMEARFVSTFEAIDKEFRHYFERLFKGGQARLELTEPGDINRTGVEIIARPPGKRAASIALLSGGERSLTAAALLFAILKVSPTPFCVFDEVDAMLDEANIGRFREVLQELAGETQFIVITHNRGTIEAARDIYGISQSDPGISEVISLQLEEAVRAAKQ